MKRRNLRNVGLLLFFSTLRNEWHPTTRDIQKRYKLTEAQVRVVKQHAKKIGDNLSVLWGWDPEYNYFRTAPDSDTETTKRMLEYQIRHWRDEGRSTAHMFNAAYKQGNIKKATSTGVAVLDQQFNRQLKIIEEDVKSL